MWHKMEDIEANHGISKFSIYAMITQEPELRKYIKALDGVLQIDDEGLKVLLKAAKTEDKPKAVEEVVEIKEEVSEVKVTTTVESSEDFFEESPLMQELEFFSNVEVSEEDLVEGGLQNSTVDKSMDYAEQGAQEQALASENKEIKLPNDEDINTPIYIKSLKEKLVIQNQQIRALNEYLEVSKKLLLQDEKIVHILEQLSK